MNRRQKNQFLMLKKIFTILEKNQEIISTVPEISHQYKEFSRLINEITRYLNQFSYAATGVFKQKKVTEKSLTLESFRLSRALKIIGKKYKIYSLYHKYKISLWEIRRFRDTQIASFSDSLVQDLMNYKKYFKDFGITLNRVNEFKQSSDDYLKSIQDIGSSVALQKASRKQYIKLIKNASDLLDSYLDDLIEMHADSFKHFYNTYFKARNIKKLGRRKRKQSVQEHNIINFKKSKKRKVS